MGGRQNFYLYFSYFMIFLNFVRILPFKNKSIIHTNINKMYVSRGPTIQLPEI